MIVKKSSDNPILATLYQVAERDHVFSSMKCNNYTPDGGMETK